MTYKLVSPAGVVVQMQRTRFQTVNINIPSETPTRASLPIGVVSPSLLQVVAQDEAIPTTTCVLRHADGNIGILYACAGGGLAVMLLDLGELQVQAWLEQSERQGHMSLILTSESAHHLVRLPVDDGLDAFTSSLSCSPASAAVVKDALDAVLEQVGDERLAPVWKRQGKTALQHCSINLVMPAMADACEAPMH